MRLRARTGRVARPDVGGTAAAVATPNVLVERLLAVQRSNPVDAVLP